MDEYEKAVAEAQELAAENQRKIDILLADMNRQELRNTRTDAAALAALERDLLNLVNGSRIKRARDRGLLRCAAATLHKVRRQLLDDADRAVLCERCMNNGRYHSRLQGPGAYHRARRQSTRGLVRRAL